jgi:ABC-type sugar transport system ATPase subunit
MPLAVLQGVRKTYRMGDEDVHALDGVDLKVGEGRILGLIGLEVDEVIPTVQGEFTVKLRAAVPGELSVEEIRRRMFVFEDINMVNDKGIQAVLKEVENDQLVLALKTASEGLKTKILNNMSSRAAETIREDMEFMGPVRISDVEAAQQKIVDIVRRLEEAGEIIIAGRGGDNDVVV